jgi:hypothetical protein
LKFTPRGYGIDILKDVVSPKSAVRRSYIRPVTSALSSRRYEKKIEATVLAGASSVGGDATLEGRTGAILGGFLRTLFSIRMEAAPPRKPKKVGPHKPPPI